MKANKTKQLIYEYTEIVFKNRKKDNKRLHEMHQVVADELQDLERLAIIGRAIEQAFDWGYEVVFQDYDYVEDEMYTLDSIQNVDRLLELLENEGE